VKYLQIIDKPNTPERSLQDMKIFYKNHATKVHRVTLLATLLVLLSSLLLFNNAHALTPTFVQANSHETNSGTTDSVPFTSANSASDLIVVYVIWSNGTSTASMSDARDNTYNAVSPATKWNGTQWSSQVFYAKNISAGSNTVTATFSSAINQFAVVYIHEYSGMDTINPLDVSTVATGTTKAMNSGSVTTTNANDLIFGAGASSSTVNATGTGFTTRSTGSGNRTEDKNVASAGSYSATATQNSNMWVMHMVAFKAGGSSTDSSSPTTPTNLTATAQSSSQINLSWTASTDNVGVTGYKVFRNGAQVGTAPNTSYSDTGLTQNTTYAYTVAAVDAAGNTSSQSAVASATTLILPADTTPPTASLTAPSDGSTVFGTVAASAKASDNVAVQKVEFYIDTSNTAASSDTSSPYTYNWDTTTVADGAHSISVKATDTNGNISTLSTSNVTVQNTDVVAPSVPANLTATPSSPTKVDLSWNASTDNRRVTGYHVYRNGTLIASPTVTTYSDTGLSPNTTYGYAVSAFDLAGNESAQSTITNATTPAQPTFAFATSVSANHRYLLDQSGNPFLIVGDSPQSAIGQMSVSEADRYFADRQAHGFNTVWINLLCDSYTFCNTNGTTYDGVKSFTSGTSPSNYDLSTPNEAYFARADDIINSAASHGLTVILDPIETGGWLDTMNNNGPTKDTNFGRYVGSRYKSFPNIIWMSGNDFQSWQNVTSDQNVLSVAQGIKSVDPTRIQTLELDFSASSSLNDSSWSNIINLNAAYTYYPTYAQVLTSYNQMPTMPAFMVEANYEFEHNGGTDGGTTPNLRRQEYWTMTSGATGQLYGSGNTDRIANGWSASDLDTIGVTQLGYVTSLLQGRAWYNLVPDQNHTLITAGYGTFQDTGLFVNNDYVTASETPDGSLALAYVPTAKTITVDMSKIGGAVTAKWYDVTNGTYSTISGSPFANNGTHQFTTPGTHTDGTSDWVLVLEGNLVPDTQAPSTPTNPVATPVSSSQINLSWEASTDDHAVSGYNIFRDGAKVGTSSTASFLDRGLAASTTYNYTVSAFDTAGNESGQSISVTGTTPAPDTTPPSTPINVQATNVTGSTISISWDGSTDDLGVAGYLVYRDSLQVTDTPQLNFSDLSLIPATTYVYTVAAYDFSGNVSPQSAPLSVTTNATLPADPLFVQLRENHVTSINSNVSTPGFSSSTQTGDTNIVWVWYNSTSQSVSSVTDSAGNTYQKAVGPTTGTGGMSGWQQEVWYASNITGSSNLVVTANFAGSFSGEKSITVEEFSGLDKTAPLDVAAGGNANGSNVSSPPITTTKPKELIFSAGLFASNGSAGSGFTQRSAIVGNTSEDQVVTTAGTYTATYTNNTQDVIVSIAAFRAAGQ